MPDEYQGIPIEHVEREEKQLLNCKCNTGYADYVYGGAGITDADVSGGVGSAACKVHRGTNQYLLTAAHLASACDRDAHGDQFIKGGENMGKVPEADSDNTYYNAPEDWMLIEQTSETVMEGYENYIADYKGKLSGHVTKDGLKDFMCSYNKTVYKQGIKTCKREGCLKARDKTMGVCSSDASSVGGVEVDMFGETGDSGGIFFKQYKFDSCYYTAPIGIISWGKDNADDVCDNDGYTTNTITGISAYHLHNQYSLYFDPDFSSGC